MSCQFSDLLGKTLTEVTKVDNERIRFVTDDGRTFQMWHSQDCCESVTIDDICGELSDLVGSPIIRAEENSSNDPVEGRNLSESFTWTFYRIETAKGLVVIRWLGESNGYYSESVDFTEGNAEQ